MFIQIESTPNPNTLKFLPGITVNSGESIEFNNENAHKSSLASTLFEVLNVEKVFFGSDFISVTKSDNIEWELLKPRILAIMLDFFSTNSLSNNGENFEEEQEEFFDISDLDKVTQIKELIANYIKPAVAQDGGDIKFRGYKDGIVFVKLKGACSGCPSAQITLKEGIHSMLSYYIPDIQAVEDVQ
ncbi:NifU family protein [Neoehrlichia mikurensis]|uniref:NifU family protein n=1 Tax=Neoehrlichia mikurensis TaxID=89586 RepID=A0A9Q9C274_9RICK|nr:NifU family protein [Neoehrlichia mikurensis]QXK92366.1 NifU family protein [Neoehrlichia mikurensis]QXK93212.1 NifU family protein [Neoehrlichia mikurensis]QXK94060.1 NifU family protein [Neoehrlichia mikurensis]UTO55949.1 NifU family protein [Neoehrlichia mikurensis]UTO56865.1 NifU family protein [Neoehrlichia mikurensis]